MHRSLSALGLAVVLAALSGCRTIATSHFAYEPVGAVPAQNRAVGILPPRSRYTADTSLGRIVLVERDVNLSFGESIIEFLALGLPYGAARQTPNGYTGHVEPDDMVAVALARECAACGATAIYLKDIDPSVPIAIGATIHRMKVRVSPQLYAGQLGSHAAAAVFDLELTPYLHGAAGQSVRCRAEVVSDRALSRDVVSVWAGDDANAISIMALEEAMQEAIARLTPQVLHAAGLVSALPPEWESTTYPAVANAGLGGTQ